MRWRRAAPLVVAAALLGPTLACIKVQRTPSHPETFDGIDAMCRRSARDYRESASAYARCMSEHGYPHQGADDY